MEPVEKKPKAAKKPRAPKAKADAGAGGGEEKPKAPKKFPKRVFIPTAADIEIAKDASMERNKGAAKLLEDVAIVYKEAGEYIKCAGLKKAAKVIAALTEPIKFAQELLALDGVGKGTVDRIAKYFAALHNDPSGGFAGAAAAADAAAGKDAAFNWVADSDRDVLINLIQTGQLSLENLRGWRSDIAASDI